MKNFLSKVTSTKAKLVASTVAAAVLAALAALPFISGLLPKPGTPPVEHSDVPTLPEEEADVFKSSMVFPDKEVDPSACPGATPVYGPDGLIDGCFTERGAGG